MIQGRNILITGGAGSVGRRLARHFLDDGASVVRIFDNSERLMSEVNNEIDSDRCRYLLGDIRDKDRLKTAMDGVDLVVHAAAMKHVDLSEYNPFEAVKTNVVGLQNVVDAAVDSDVQRLVFTSSDKAVYSANTMGTTKLLGEKLVTAGNKYKGREDLRLTSVRFGNVINSSQSVVPIFQKQIEGGGPVTLTDPAMTRFFLTFEDLADLVTAAMQKTKGGEIFIHKMPAMHISDLAGVMIEELAPNFGYASSEIDVDVIGKRIGETLHEEFVTDREAERTLENERMYVVPPETSEENGYLSFDGIEGFEPAENLRISSKDVDKLNKKGIKDLLIRGGVLEG